MDKRFDNFNADIKPEATYDEDGLLTGWMYCPYIPRFTTVYIPPQQDLHTT